MTTWWNTDWKTARAILMVSRMWAISAATVLVRFTFIDELICCLKGPCQYRKSKVVARCSGAVNVTSGDEAGLTTAIASGPVAVIVDSDHFSFRFYSGGYYYEPNCRPEVVDQSLLAVGYGSFGDNKDYYILRNMWDTHWVSVCCSSQKTRELWIRSLILQLQTGWQRLHVHEQEPR